MIRFLFILMLLLLPRLTHGQISIRIFSRVRPVSVIFTPATGDYSLHSPGRDSILVGIGTPVVLTLYEARVIFKTISGETQAADSVFIRPLNTGANFSLRAPGKNEQVKTLNGKLLVKPFPGSLLVLNITDIENYLPGVVRAEAGSRGPVNYFRAQAVVARTYAWRHTDRHQLDGYNLCDDTHCQAFPGIITEKIIIDACNSTWGKVLVDKDSVLIVSAFHANCGGQTAASSDVWVTPQPYLVSVIDPYCTETNNARWERRIRSSAWKSFLKTKKISTGEGLPVPVISNDLSDRTSLTTIAGTAISNEDIRAAFRLKSSYFTIIPVADSVMIRGKGYGHGVGLCQDGARIMASKGMVYSDITRFYYPGTAIIDIKYARKPVRP